MILGTSICVNSSMFESVARFNDKLTSMKTLLLLSVLVSLNAFSNNDYEPRSSSEKFRSVFNDISAKVMGELDIRGLSFASHGQKVSETWDRMAMLTGKQYDESPISNFEDTNYQKEFSRLTNSFNGNASNVEFLVNGPQSFEKRKKLIDGAQSSILMMVWAIYDDLTGKVHTNWLLEKLKKSPELLIRIIVDGQIAMSDHHYGELRKLEKMSGGRIQIIRWISKRYRANGFHRKVFIVDQEKVIMGGINVGDYYSHMNPEVPGWRDTDIYMEGTIGQRASEIFQKVWNEQIKENNLGLSLLNLPVKQTRESERYNISLVDHNPGHATQKADINILMAYVKLMNDAKTSIDIENAYLILNPILEKSLKDAIKRGVKVRILTNSSQSVDEPVVSVPILECSKIMFKAGAEVYLKTGTTLHSKFMIIDKKIAIVGSDNLHPRSQKYEGEVISVVFNEEAALKLTDVFEEDIRTIATTIQSESDFVIKKTFLSTLIKRFFYNQL